MSKKNNSGSFRRCFLEHDVSTVSAKGILSNINKEKYNLVLIGISKTENGFCLMMISTFFRMMNG